MSDTALTTKPASAMRYELAPEDYVEGTQGLTREDLQIPQLVLVQPQSKNVPEAMKHAGELFNNLTGEFRNEVNGILLSESKGRVCFPRDYDGDSDPVCASDDGLHPRDQYVGTVVHDKETDFDTQIGDACADCPLARFGNDSTPPMCAKTFSYAMIDAETGIPFVMRAQRTGMQAAKQLNTIAKTLGRRKFIRISSRAVQSDKGNYFVPSFTTNGDTEPSLKQWALKYSLEVGNIAQRASLTDGAPTKQISAPVEPTEEEMPF